MKITTSQLRKIIKEEVQKAISETRDAVGDSDLRAAFEELNTQSGAPMLENLEAYLGVAPGMISLKDLIHVGLTVEDGQVVERI